MDYLTAISTLVEHRNGLVQHDTEILIIAKDKLNRVAPKATWNQDKLGNWYLSGVLGKHVNYMIKNIVNHIDDAGWIDDFMGETWSTKDEIVETFAALNMDPSPYLRHAMTRDRIADLISEQYGD